MLEAATFHQDEVFGAAITVSAKLSAVSGKWALLTHLGASFYNQHARLPGI